ncbi:MAG TPA: hypothetical protein VNU49_08730 [Opitutaceae bacterium]|nr:hypothetical protein [Opitutaceae bacterium]
MKQILALLMAFLPNLAKADGTKLGSDSDPIRQMLFASQSIKELLSHVQLDGKPGPFQTIADASKLVADGRKKDAVVLLRSVLQTPALETRVQLWVWSCLRELGEKPDPKAAYEVLGVVIEMPSGGAYDTLAAYVDGSARYLNFSGKAIFWDAQDSGIKSLCQAFIDSTIPASSRAKPRTRLSLPKDGAQVTLLTRSGIYVITDPPEPVVGAAAALMIELMKRAKEKND